MSTFRLWSGITLGITLLALGSAAGIASGQSGVVGKDAGLPCVSRPSELRELGFSVRGRIAEVLVKAGDAVKAGQPLVRLDDDVQKQLVAYAKLQATDESTLRMTRASLAFREIELTKLQEAIAGGAGGDAQLREARFRRDTAKLEIEAAENRLKLYATEQAREEARLGEMSIQSPIDATVLEVRKKEGETVDEGNPVLVLVSVDPLWLEVNVPTRDAGAIAPGQPAEVVFEDIDDAKPMPGKVIFKSPAGNAGARQVQVRVEVPNPAKIPSGMHGRVKFLDRRP